MDGFTLTEYTLRNVLSGNRFKDSGWLLDDPSGGEASLIRAEYEKKQINVRGPEYGIYRFADWLPVKRMLRGSAAPVTYKSEGLAKVLGLENLYITFSGYFPKIGAAMNSCSFKETEAYSVCGRMSQDFGKILVVASAGNTARAFAKVCSENNIPLLLSVPRDNLSALWFTEPLRDCVKLICPGSGGDYFDAIHLGNLALQSSRFVAEGGAKNVARRDGMGTTVLSAVDHIRHIPDYYFQAVGSGTGAIAAWEANMRLIDDGRFGQNKMKLIVSQNAPFLPIYEAWRADSRQMLAYDESEARRDAEEIDAKVLSNRKPPYPIAGGLYDALKDTVGDVVAVNNDQLREAARIFEESEGVDIHPAAAVATWSLMEYVKSSKIKSRETVMLNITGGGEKLVKSEWGKELWYLQPSRVFELDPDPDTVVRFSEGLF